MTVKEGSFKRIGKRYTVMLSRPIGDWSKLKLTITDHKEGLQKSATYMKRARAIAKYKFIDTVSKIKYIWHHGFTGRK